VRDASDERRYGSLVERGAPMDAERKPEELGIGGPVGTVEVRFFEVVSCWVRWGGWKWQADGPDEEHARERLRQRLQALDPFFGGPDYGRYGQPADGPDSLDPAIRKRTRTKMAYYMDFIEKPRVKAAARDKSRGLKRA
jgi:hypothetical protein